MNELEPTPERLEAARLAELGNWNVERGAEESDPVLMEMLDAGLLTLIYTPQLHAQGLDGVRVVKRGWQWLARADQESQR